MFGDIKHITLTLPTPAENLACDEALLDACESQEMKQGGVLRFWESADYFVVVGYGNKVSAEVNQAACAELNVPILRRCSGGGTVVQGPGCLNYSLILPMGDSGPLVSITGANRFIMQQNREAVQLAVGEQKAIGTRGCTDIAVDEVKFSGNAQRRKKHYLLFHGTFLLNFDLTLIEKLLLMPSKEPDYRKNRPHAKFVTNLHVGAGSVTESLRSVWNATMPLNEVPTHFIAELVREKYTTAGWNFKF